MSIIDIATVLDQKLGEVSSTTSSPRRQEIKRAQLEKASEKNPAEGFNLQCIKHALAASALMQLGVDGGRFASLNTGKTDGGDSSPTLPQLRRDAVRHGTSVALELLRLEVRHMQNLGQPVMLNHQLVHSITRRLNVSQQKREDLQREMELELRRVDARHRIMQEHIRLDISLLEQLFVNKEEETN